MLRTWEIRHYGPVCDVSETDLLARNPHHVILLIGTNDIPDKNMTAETIAEKINMEIGKRIEDHGIRCTISELYTIY